MSSLVDKLLISVDLHRSALLTIVIVFLDYSKVDRRWLSFHKKNFSRVIALLIRHFRNFDFCVEGKFIFLITLGRNCKNKINL